MTVNGKQNIWAVFTLCVFAGSAAFGCVDREIIATLLPDGETDTVVVPVDSNGNFSGDLPTDAEDTADTSAEEKIVDGCGDSDGVWDNRVFIDYGPELDAFNANNRVITRIAGDLVIEDVEGESISLEQLKELRCVDGSLIIKNVPGLKNLDNLSNLWRVGGSVLMIEENAALPNCEAARLYEKIKRPDWDKIICIDDNAADVCADISINCPDQYQYHW
jgi:hypothetical protein